MASDMLFNESSPQLLIDAVQGIYVMVKEEVWLCLQDRQTFGSQLLGSQSLKTTK